MARKRLTQLFPFLLPLRTRQKKLFFYSKMRFDKNIYSKKIEQELMPYEVFSTSSLMINQNSGFDLKYQYNKVHNLKIASEVINRLVIKPGETFSFWQVVRHADKKRPYKDGLNLVDGKIVGSYGGGLCQLSNMLFWMFLHTSMTIVERHTHAVASFPPTTDDFLYGTDATIHEGWLDLKVKNETNFSFQIYISFDDNCMYGHILSDNEPFYKYRVFNKSVSYYKECDRVHQVTTVNRIQTNNKTNEEENVTLYNNTCEIGYELPDNVFIEEKGDQICRKK